MARHAGYCPCALYRGRARIIRRASLGPSDNYPARVLECYYIALSAEIFDGFPNIDWPSLSLPSYPRLWVKHILTKVPHARIVYRRLQRCRDDLDLLQFEEYMDLANSTRSKRAVKRCREFFERWILKLNLFIDAADPVLRVDPELGAFNTYLASWKNGVHEFAFSIAQPITHTKAPLLPHGTSADIDAVLTLHNKALLLTATNVTGLFVATDDHIRGETRKLYQPVLNVTGKITCVHVPDIRFPGVKVVDVTVESGGLWPYHSTTLVAYFNRVERNLRMRVPPTVGMSVTLTGELCGWVNGTIAVDVDDFDFNNDGPVPAGPLATLPNLFQKLNFGSDFAVFADPSRLPPLAGRPSAFAAYPGDTF
ncbi:hypothetical protein AURDEDRAFT_174478 [Auricularia subglabra TFB-10046 SS5]|uniref:Uncharacterized protein n=1 Tax=Auricularia subglabra (strain TFB-10046 / SS5) TaxID=717982 RepID=J0WT15_AURST|nr:hypothetical protein AURDEDRAFT_174478 [Auricularia subglabra TFB-10046 SS5]